MIAPHPHPKYTQNTQGDTKEAVVTSAKLFSDRLNQCLDDTGAPASVRERAVILSKLADIPKPLAWNLLDGHHSPNSDTVEKLASEFEVDPQWLAGDKI
jgi:hypothetical protein